MSQYMLWESYPNFYLFSRVMYVEKGEIFGSWNTVWEYRYEEIKEPPEVTDKGIKIMLTVIILNRNALFCLYLCSFYLPKTNIKKFVKFF